MRGGKWQIAAACLVFAVGFAGGASGNPVVFLVWSDTTSRFGTPGSSDIIASNGDTLMAEAFISAMPGQGISAYTLTLEWDFDFVNELDLVGYAEDKPLAGILPDLPEIVTESDDTTVGSITNLDDFSIVAEFEEGGTFRIAKFTFRVNGNVFMDGEDVRIGLVAATDTVGVPGTILSGVTTFQGAEVNYVPEPAAVGLLAFGLLGIAAAAGRNRR